MAFTPGNDTNIVQATDSDVISAGLGDDIYVLAPSQLAANQQVSISDADGANTLKLVGGLSIESSKVANDTAQLTLSNGAVVTLQGASTFNFNVGGTSLTGGVEKDYDTFAQETLGVTVPAAGEPVVEGGTSNINEDGSSDVTPPTGGGVDGENFMLTAAIDADAAGELPAEYTLTDTDADFGELAVAGVAEAKANAQTIIDGASNAEEDALELNATYTLKDSLANLVAAEDGVVEGADAHTLTETAFTAEAVTSDVAGLEAAQTAAEEEFFTEAEQAIVDGAANTADVTVDVPYALEDTLASLVAAEDGVVEGAESHTLTETAFTAEAVTSDVAGLEAAQTAAEEEFFTEAEQAIVDGAANTADVTVDVPYALEDTLASLVAAEDGVVEGAESHTLTNENAELGVLSEAEKAIVDGAENSDDFIVTEVLTLNEALAADTLPESYELDASVPRIDNNASVADATAALDIITGASNAADINVADVYVWKVEDSAESIVAAIESGAITDAGEVRVAFEEGDQLTVEQSEALNGLDNLVGDLPPVDAEGAVLAGLQTLEAAQNAEAEFLEQNADNEVLGFEEGDEPITDVKQAIKDADTAADIAVVDAENAVLDKESDLTEARASEFQSAKGTDVAQGEISTAVTKLDSVNVDTRMSDANLAAAATEAQENVDADERVYNAADGSVIVNADGTVASDYSEVYKADVDGDGTADDYITKDLADVAQETVYDYTSDAASGFKLTVNGNDYTGATLSALQSAIDTGEADITATESSTELKLVSSAAGTAFTTSGAAANDGSSEPVTVEEDASQAVANFDTSEFVANNESVGFVADPSNVSAGVVEGNGDENVLTDEDTATAAELQTDVAATAAAVENARAAQSDADLLTDINAAINAHIAAGGDDVEPASGESLLDLRSDINTKIANVAEGDTLQLDKGNGVFDDSAYTSVKVLEELAGAGTATDGVVTIEQAEAPETGEGTWVKGQETGTPGVFTFTYEPSAEEQALVGAVKDVEGRVELLKAEDAAESSFGNTDTGGVFNTVVELQEDRDDLVEAIETANTELTEAEATAAQTQELVDQLDALEQQITDAEKALTDSAEEGGLGVNLVDFEDNGPNATATATANDDVILFSAAEDGDSIANFGAAGDDRFYVGTEFTQTDLGEDAVFTDAQGDPSVLEVFVQQQGGNTVLSFEDETFAGNGSSEADLTQIELTGVTGDVSISDDGFLTIA